MVKGAVTMGRSKLKMLHQLIFHQKVTKLKFGHQLLVKKLLLKFEGAGAAFEKK
jgi:hypothetical protein